MQQPPLSSPRRNRRIADGVPTDNEPDDKKCVWVAAKQQPLRRFYSRWWHLGTRGMWTTWSPVLLLLSYAALVNGGSCYPGVVGNCTLANSTNDIGGRTRADSLYPVITNDDDDDDHHRHHDKVLKRTKRFLLWSGSGISKSVLGITVPVETADRVNWRSLNVAYNFQAQYVPVPSVIFPWTRFDRALDDHKRQYEQHGTYRNDGTRRFVYTAYEMIMKRRGQVDGRECLLRAICEAAETPVEHVGVFDQVLQLFLTPNEHDADSVYLEAKQAGQHGVDCLSLYHKCPMGYGLLDGISYFKSPG